MEFDDELKRIKWREHILRDWPKGTEKDVPQLQQTIVFWVSNIGWDDDPMYGTMRDSRKHHHVIFQCGMALGEATTQEELIEKLSAIRVDEQVAA